MTFPFGTMCKTCSSCAIVVPSGHLINSMAGKEIDAHECVLRLNGAPTNGYRYERGMKGTWKDHEWTMKRTWKEQENNMKGT